MLRVANMYAEGEGTSKNEVEAYFWALLAERLVDPIDRERASTRRVGFGERISALSREEVAERVSAWKPAPTAR
jgi:hypothetical protein